MTFSTLNQLTTTAFFIATTVVATSFTMGNVSTESTQTDPYSSMKRSAQEQGIAYRAAGRFALAAYYRGSEHGVG